MNYPQAPSNQQSINYAQQFNNYPQNDVMPEPLPPKKGDVYCKSGSFKHCSSEPRVH
jgi:hypothetical protein